MAWLIVPLIPGRYYTLEGLQAWLNRSSYHCATTDSTIAGKWLSVQPCRVAQSLRLAAGDQAGPLDRFTLIFYAPDGRRGRRVWHPQLDEKDGGNKNNSILLPGAWLHRVARVATHVSIYDDRLRIEALRQLAADAAYE